MTFTEPVPFIKAGNEKQNINTEIKSETERFDMEENKKEKELNSNSERESIREREEEECTRRCSRAEYLYTKGMEKQKEKLQQIKKHEEEKLEEEKKALTFHPKLNHKSQTLVIHIYLL